MTIDPIFNKYKTLFSILDTLEIVKPNTKNVVLYLNLESILKVLFTSELNTKLLSETNENELKTSMISNIINLAQHYRWYFSKKGYNCHVYIYWNYSGEDYNNRKYIDNYRSYYHNRLFNTTSCAYLSRCLQSIYNITAKIISYINQVDIINGGNTESSVIPYVIYKNRYQNDAEHIIISNDKYDFQYVRYDFKILVPKQSNTKIITKDNVIDVMKHSMNIKSNDSVPYQFITFIISLLGCKYRNIDKISGIGLGTLIKYINNALNSLTISENTKDIETLSKVINDKFKDKFINNYKCTDIEYQYNNMSELDMHNILNQIIDKYDDNTLYYINDRYFQSCPIFIVKDHKEQILNTENRKSIFDR